MAIPSSCSSLPDSQLSTRRLPCLTDAALYEEIKITMVAARPERAQEES
jgi:hypothetical protein